MPRMLFSQPTLSQPVSGSNVSLTGSPFVYKPSRATLVVIQGGTVSLIELSTNGTTFTTLGVLAGQQLVPAGCSLRVTYVTAPMITAIPL